MSRPRFLADEACKICPFNHPSETGVDRSVSFRRPAFIAVSFVMIVFVAIGLTDTAAHDPDQRGADAVKSDAAAASNRDANLAEIAPKAATKTIAIAGICTDEMDRPLAGVKVVLYRRTHVLGWDHATVQEVLTNPEGRYRFANVEVPPPQIEVHTNYVSVLTAPGRASKYVFTNSLEEDQVQKVKMPPAATLKGRVTGSGSWQASRRCLDLDSRNHRSAPGRRHEQQDRRRWLLCHHRSGAV